MYQPYRQKKAIQVNKKEQPNYLPDTPKLPASNEPTCKGYFKKSLGSKVSNSWQHIHTTVVVTTMQRCYLSYSHMEKQ
jgi:hypothetical protein